MGGVGRNFGVGPWNFGVSQVFYWKGIIKNFAKFTRKHLRWSLHLNKVAGPRPQNSLKNRFQHRCLLVNFAKFLRTAAHFCYCFFITFFGNNLKGFQYHHFLCWIDNSFAVFFFFRSSRSQIFYKNSYS